MTKDRAIAQLLVIAAEKMEENMALVNAGKILKSLLDPAKDSRRPQSQPTLEEITRLLMTNLKLKLLVVGHTDSQGTPDFNLDLSRPAAKVFRELTSNYRLHLVVWVRSDAVCPHPSLRMIRRTESPKTATSNWCSGNRVFIGRTNRVTLRRCVLPIQASEGSQTRMLGSFRIAAILISFAVAPLLAAAAAGTEAKLNQYSQRIWHVEQGLPQNRVSAISETPDGYLWIGTSEGLARFDGVRFTIFDRSNTSALQDDAILALLLAKNGSLWIATEGGGVVQYSDGVFRSYSSRQGLTNGFVRCLYEDSRGTLWVGTDRGFFRLDGDHFIRLDKTADIPLATVLGIAEDTAGNIWAASSAGVLTLANGRLVRAHTDCAAPNIRLVQSSGHDYVWAVHSSGVSRMRFGCATHDSSLPDVPIRWLREDSDGNLWICTIGKGLIRSRGGHNTYLTTADGLPDNNVNVVFEDREKNLWVGCEDGLLQLSRSPVTSIGSAEGLDDNDVLTVSASRGRSLWIATLAGQVYRLSGRTATRHLLPSPLAHSLVETVFEDRSGALWFGTYRQGLIRQSGNSIKVYTRAEGLRSNTVRQVLQDSTGDIWIALESGFSRWNGHAFHNYYLEDGLSYPSTRCMIFDAGGDLLIGTDSGLNRVHNSQIVRDAEFKSLAHEKIWSIYEDRSGTLWLGTRGGGLLRYRAGAVFRFTTGNGFPSNAVFQILEDRNGSLWMSTSRGIVSVERGDLDAISSGSTRSIRIVSYGTGDGMATSQMNGGIQPAGAATTDGDLWFPSVKGAVRVKPLEPTARSAAPVIIERVVFDDRPIPMGSSVSIPPGRGKLEIDFTRCDLADPLRLAFRYKLEGFDDRWTVAARSRSAYYTNLPPGNYHFHLIASNPVSSSTSEATLAITRVPAFYQTGWFFALLTVAAGSLVWCGFTLYARQTRLRYDLLLNERARLAREIHDTVIQGCVSVSALLEAADGYKQVDTVAANAFIDDARHQVIETIEEARQAVWDLRNDTSSRSSIQILFDLARQLGERQGIQIDTEIMGEGTPDAATDHTLLLVGREALRNAVSHSHARRILVRVTFAPTELTLQIDDDGVGFSTDVYSAGQERHFGLAGMGERVEEAGGKFVLDTAPGNGTRITARFPAGIIAARDR